MRSLVVAGGLLGLALASSAALADEAKVPKSAQGVWAAGGKCHGETMTIAAATLQYKGQKPEAVFFAPKESPRGYGAIHASEEGSVDNFEYADDKDLLLYNPEGYGMGKPPVVYKRCR